jgi:DNA recombination protein RmuC
LDIITIGSVTAASIFGVTAAYSLLRLTMTRQILSDRSTELALQQQRAESLASELSAAQVAVRQLDAENRTLTARLTESAASLRYLEERYQEQKAQFEKSSEQMLTKFEVLSGRILNAQSEKFEAVSRDNLQTVLSPLREHLQQFQKKVEDTHLRDVRDRSSLEEQIRSLSTANGQLIAEANNLARALKGNAKAQGNWGEIMLERILESAGLREGQEYVREGEGMKLQDESGRLQRPDVILNLPDEKHIVIDSKVSLIAYERSLNLEVEEERQKALREHIESIERHVSQLAAKHYSKNKLLNAPDFVLMFMPVESALSCAYSAKPELFQTAWSKGVIIASPTTLIATAQTVSSIWRMEQQNQNALKIADQGAKLYDKFAGFVDDMDQTRRSLDVLGRNFNAAMNKLSEGKGNLVASAEKLRKLGLTTRKRIKAQYLAEDNTEEQAALTAAPAALLEPVGASKD